MWHWKRPYVLLLLIILPLTSCQPQISGTVVQLPTLIPSHPAPSPFPTVPPLPTITQTPTATASTSPTPTLTPLPPTPTAVPPTATAVPSIYQQILQTQPGEEPISYLSQLRLVAYYGTPLGPALGILGNQPRETMIDELRATTQIYADLDPEMETIPAFHIIITVADRTPPYYRHHINLDLVEEWVALAEELEFAVILDIQPGHVSSMYELDRIRPLLSHPHVHFAIDPEFVMDGNQVPGRDLGQLYAKEINDVQAELDQISQEIGVKKVLILHQFANKMLPDKENIIDYPNVEIVIDGDGVGYSETKINNYHRYADQPAFEFGGFKLFPTDGDSPVLTPQEIMDRLTPPPALIIYQ